MKTIEEAIRILRDNTPTPQLCATPLLAALGRRLSEDIMAPEPSPRFTNSAMDGFAVSWSQVRSATAETPALLKIAGESQAGKPYAGLCQDGQAIQISTGAMLPEGTDTVIRVEDTETEAETVRILRVKKMGQDVRYRGEEFQSGDLLLSKDTVLQAPQLALLASVGITEVTVIAPPQVALALTGTELVEPGQPIEPYQIRDSNSIMLAAAVRQSGGEVVSCQRVQDSLEETAAALRHAAEQAHIIIFSGGVSVGQHDHVKDAAEQCGFTRLFWRVKQKPGKPLYVARKGETLLFGLPGNPVSGYMCYMYYIQPLIRSLQGREFSWRSVRARVMETVTNDSNRTNFLRIRLGQDSQGQSFEILHGQGSHMLSSIAHADGFIIIEPGETMTAGSLQSVYLFPWRK